MAVDSRVERVLSCLRAWYDFGVKSRSRREPAPLSLLLLLRQHRIHTMSFFGTVAGNLCVSLVYSPRGRIASHSFPPLPRFINQHGSLLAHSSSCSGKNRTFKPRRTQADSSTRAYQLKKCVEPPFLPSTPLLPSPTGLEADLPPISTDTPRRRTSR